jgi:hypothetical protein
LAFRPFHKRPGFLTRLLGDLTRRLWGQALGVACLPTYEGRRQGDAHELIFWTSRWSVRVPGLPRNWFRAVYRRGMACHEGRLVVKVERPRPYDKGVDFFFHRCRPVPGPFGPMDVERDRVPVARGPAGEFRSLPWDWWRK